MEIMCTIIYSKYQKMDYIICDVNINITGPDADPTYPTDFTNFYLEESMYSWSFYSINPLKYEPGTIIDHNHITLTIMKINVRMGNNG